MNEAGPSCPQCGKPLVHRQSQYGPFLGCSGFPACRYIQRDADASPPARRKARPAGRAARAARRPAADGSPSTRTKHVIPGRRAAVPRGPRRAVPPAAVQNVPAPFEGLTDDDLPF